MNQFTTNCAFCTTVLCEGCKQILESTYQPFFKGYKPQFYFRTNYKLDTKTSTESKMGFDIATNEVI